jgi:hypothetical protein
MDTPAFLEFYNFFSPSVFRIEVKGNLDDSFSELWGEIKLTHHKKMGVDITRLEGEIADQAALLGILNALYDRRLPLIKVIVNNNSD